MPGWFICFACFIRSVITWLPRENWPLDGVRIEVVKGDAFVFASGPLRRSAVVLAAALLDADKKNAWENLPFFIGEYAKALEPRDAEILLCAFRGRETLERLESGETERKSWTALEEWCAGVLHDRGWVLFSGDDENAPEIKQGGSFDSLDWSNVEWPNVEPGTILRCDVGVWAGQYVKVLKDEGKFLMVRNAAGQETGIGKRWLGVSGLHDSILRAFVEGAKAKDVTCSIEENAPVDVKKHCGVPYDELGLRCELGENHHLILSKENGAAELEHIGRDEYGDMVRWSDPEVRDLRRAEGVPEDDCGAPHASGLRCKLAPSICHERRFSHVGFDEIGRPMGWNDLEGELFHNGKSVHWKAEEWSVRYLPNGAQEVTRNDVAKADETSEQQSSEGDAENKGSGETYLPTTISCPKRTYPGSERNHSEIKTEDLDGCGDGANVSTEEKLFNSVWLTFRRAKSYKHLVQCLYQWVTLHPCADSPQVRILVDMWHEFLHATAEDTWIRSLEDVESRVRWLLHCIILDKERLPAKGWWQYRCHLAFAGSVAEVFLADLCGQYDYRSPNDLNAADDAMAELVRGMLRAALAGPHKEMIASPERLEVVDVPMSPEYVRDQAAFMTGLAGLASGKLVVLMQKEGAP